MPNQGVTKENWQDVIREAVRAMPRDITEMTACDPEDGGGACDHLRA